MYSAEAHFVSDIKEASVIEHIKNLLKKSSRVVCVSPYLAHGGWLILRPILSKWLENKNASLQLLVGTDEAYPEEQAVMGINSYGNVEIRTASMENFPVNQWLFYQPEEVTVFPEAFSITRSGMLKKSHTNIIYRYAHSDIRLLDRLEQFKLIWDDATEVPKGDVIEFDDNGKIV